MDPRLPAGVTLRRLALSVSGAGRAIDLFNRDKHTVEPVQWNFVTSRPNTLRGVHVHPRHTDYLTVTDVDGALELLTGLAAGSPDAEGNVPAGSVNHLVVAALAEMVVTRQELAAPHRRRRASGKKKAAPGKGSGPGKPPARK